MIDLRKPLEGVPGLLLLAALVLFGATLGVTAALALSWVEMKDSIANFLGGVVGAGLGAALAVLGSVYVQRKDKRDGLTEELNKILSRCSDLTADLVTWFKGMIEESARLVKSLEARLRAFAQSP